MNEHADDATLLRLQRRFLEEVERSIRVANRDILQETIPELNQERFVQMALRVARLRASYLQVALGSERDPDSAPGASAWATRLREHREAFEEACAAFDALQRAIERGYVDIGLSSG
jgi:hypothetical protein